MLGDVEPSSAPPAEIHVDEALLRGLLRAQHPDLSELQLIAVGHGWDNTIFRLGDELALRLPRRKLAAPLIENEQRWLPVLARRLNLSVPEPVRVGVPGAGFPWAWSVVPWLDGQPSTLTGPSENYARPLAEFLSALHGPAPADAPENPFRGVPLSRIEARCEQRLQRLNQQGRLSLDLSPRLQALLRRTMAQASKADTPRTWIHGDLHPDNILVANQRLTAVIDWGIFALAIQQRILLPFGRCCPEPLMPRSFVTM